MSAATFLLRLPIRRSRDGGKNKREEGRNERMVLGAGFIASPLRPVLTQGNNNNNINNNILLVPGVRASFCCSALQRVPAGGQRG